MTKIICYANINPSEVNFMKFENKMILLTLNISKNEFSSNQKLREKIDTFTTIVNDRLCDKFKEEIMFDALFDENDNSKLYFTVDSPIAVTETCKTISKLLKDKKFTSLANRYVEFEESCCEC